MSDSVKKYKEMNELEYTEVLRNEWFSNEQKDPIVESVISKFKKRSDEGIKKYGTTLQGSNEDVLAFINHAQEEAMDYILYLEKLKSFYK